MKLGELVGEVERRLRKARLHYGHGTTNARDEAAFIVLRGLGLPFEAPADREVSRREALRVERLVRRRIRERMPAAYLLHEAWLQDARFYVDQRVIVPRSHIAGMLRERLRPWLPRAPSRILDLCTGSGCLAILAAQAFPQSCVEAADLSARALAVAARNVEIHRLRSRVCLVRSDLFAALCGPYDLIVCNPPYVGAASMRRLPAEYRHEPRMALASGSDGLDFVRRLLGEVPSYLTSRGTLVCEIGAGRRVLERAYPRLPFTWTAEGTVFVLARGELG